ncbi:hypothetical protein ACPPVU_07775 [Mucilaginibacter sp. McL0603]|uniref:hypothetical protein n=1 Tax=Mucilaginibacter sp. McL0603 TaxID=3415670 RepID=UPI003CF3519C
MNNEFDEVMRKRSDADLIRILNSAPGDYQPAAFEAATNEFARRNLSEAEVITAKEDIEQNLQLDKRKANEPLGIEWKIFAAICPGIIQVMFAGTFKADGYDRKAKEMFKWTLYGVGFYIGFFILMVLLTIVF